MGEVMRAEYGVILTRPGLGRTLLKTWMSEQRANEYADAVSLSPREAVEVARRTVTYTEWEPLHGRTWHPDPKETP